MLLIAGLLLFLPLVRSRPESRSQKRGGLGSGSDKGNGPSVTSDIGKGNSVQASSGKIDAKDRDEMLDGVRNLARDNPKKVASMVRHWMKE